MTYWMIRKEEGSEEYWSGLNVKGWVSASDAEVFNDVEQSIIKEVPPHAWVELCNCDGCGELMPCDTGEDSMGYYSSASIDPPENLWHCEVCLGRYEAAEETREEALREQYYDEK